MYGQAWVELGTSSPVKTNSIRTGHFGQKRKNVYACDVRYNPSGGHELLHHEYSVLALPISSRRYDFSVAIISTTSQL